MPLQAGSLIMSFRRKNHSSVDRWLDELWKDHQTWDPEKPRDNNSLLSYTLLLTTVLKVKDLSISFAISILSELALIARALASYLRRFH